MIRQAGVKILMRQTLDVDLKRYCWYLHGATAQTRRAIQAFPKRCAIVVLPDGTQHKFQFHERESEHISHTPQAQTALVKFATMDLDVETLSLRDMSSSTGEAPSSSSSPTRSTAKKPPAPMKERLYALLAENPTLRPADLVQMSGCSSSTASEARRAYFARHPKQKARTGLAEEKKPSAREQVFALLSQDITLTARELEERTGYADRTVRYWRTVYGAPPHTRSRTMDPPSLSDADRIRLEAACQRLTEREEYITQRALRQEARINGNKATLFLQERYGKQSSNAGEA